MPVLNTKQDMLAFLFGDQENALSPLHLYALADPAQDKRLPGALHAAHSACLLGDDASIRKASPHLVELPDNPSAPYIWDWMARHAVESPCLILLTSRLDFDDLFKHLCRFLEVRVNQSTVMLLAWWDPSVLASLLGSPDDATLYVKGPVFNAEQRAAFVAPLHDIGYWDRTGALHRVNIRQLITPAPAKSGDDGEPVLPLVFDAGQVRELVRATTPDQVLYELRLNRPGVLSDRSDLENYRLTCRLVDAAGRYTIHGMRDLVNFVGTGMILGEGFDMYPAIARKLEGVSTGARSFTDMLSSLPSEVLEQARRSAMEGAAG